MMTPIATRFVDWDIPELSTLQDSKVYKLSTRKNKNNRNGQHTPLRIFCAQPFRN